MTETKYKFKRSSAIQITTYIAFAVVTLIFLLIGIVSLFYDSELAIVARYFCFPLAIFGLIATLMQIFVISKLYYINLTDGEMTIYRVFPTRLKYSDIKRISFSGDMLKGVDTGLYMPWPILLNLENPKEFIKELSQKYKKNTGKNIIIQENF